mgnify:CR=1 FL=1
MKKQLLIIPSIIFFLILFVFFYLLTIERDPSKIPSNLLNKNFPNFESESLLKENKFIALEEFKNEKILVNFFASWCKPCRIENPNVVKLYNEYHDKGLNIIGVSLDKNGQKDKWLKAIEDDGLTWQHVSNLEYWKGPVAQMYSVSSIPATFILDENGIIVAKDLRGDALEAKIAEMLP